MFSYHKFHQVFSSSASVRCLRTKMFVIILLVFCFSGVFSLQCKDEDCFNELNCCDGWAIGGFCTNETTEAYMTANCRAACGNCTPKYEVDEDKDDCKDYCNAEMCEKYAEEGRCDDENQYWMEENCRESCSSKLRSSCGYDRYEGCTDEPPNCDEAQEYKRGCDGCPKTCGKFGLTELCWDTEQAYTFDPCPFKCMCKKEYIADWRIGRTKECIKPVQCLLVTKPGLDFEELSETLKGEVFEELDFKDRPDLAEAWRLAQLEDDDAGEDGDGEDGDGDKGGALAD